MNFDSAAQAISDKLKIPQADASVIIDKAFAGGEIVNPADLEPWLTHRFFPNCVFIDEIGYAQMCVDALKILPSIAATDYGSSRQRDMGQLWADMTRGYLGEYAFKLYMKNRFGIGAKLGHEKGELAGYLPMDIHMIDRVGEPTRPPHLNIGIKAVKWNGIWFDIPGDQFNHSDVHVLVKVGAGRDHLFAFFKSLSVFKDKVLKKGEEIGSLTAAESTDLYDKLPSFAPIPAYICGFALRSTKYLSCSHVGKKGRMHYKIHAWNGPIAAGDLDLVKQKEGISGKGKIQFSGIGEFTHDSGYLFNTGNLLWKQDDWDSVFKAL
jgi:hypothetical protein